MTLIGGLCILVSGLICAHHVALENPLSRNPGKEMVQEVPAITQKRRECGAASGPDVLMGTPGADVIVGRGGVDVVNGRGGDDIICGRGGADTLRGGTATIASTVVPALTGSGAVRVTTPVSGGRSHDTVHGNSGREQIRGRAGNDTLDGGKKRDGIIDGAGNDVLLGRHGGGSLVGGPGADRALRPHRVLQLAGGRPGR